MWSQKKQNKLFNLLLDLRKHSVGNPLALGGQRRAYCCCATFKIEGIAHMELIHSERHNGRVRVEVRWNHRHRASIGPNRAIPIATSFPPKPPDLSPINPPDEIFAELKNMVRSYIRQTKYLPNRKTWWDHKCRGVQARAVSRCPFSSNSRASC